MSATPQELQSLRNMGPEGEAAADEIVSLRARLDAIEKAAQLPDLNASVPTIGHYTEELRDHALHLAAENLRLREDAERIDWLQSTTDPEHGWYVDDSGAPIFRGELEALWSKTIREAIDAARKGRA